MKMAAAAAAKDTKVPLDVESRNYFLRAGNFAQAAYDGFDDSTGNSISTEEKLFSKVGLVDASKYRIHRFLYATTGPISIGEHYIKRLFIKKTWTGISNWIGYVAYGTEAEIESSGKLEIFVALRGTMTKPEWASDADVVMVPANELLIPGQVHGVVPNSFFSDDAKVHDGFLSLYTAKWGMSNSLRAQIHESVAHLVDRYTHLKPTVVVTGHSLGGAIATLAAYDLAVNNNKLAVDGVVFSTPPVGNATFKKQVDWIKGLRISHFWISIDAVPQYPIITGQDYVAVQTAELVLDPAKSLYLTNTAWSAIPFVVHNLEVVLHLLAGYDGKDGPFKFVVPRSLALINKSTDAYLSKDVPGNWWSDKNKKGMVFDTKTQEWVLKRA